MQFTNVKLLVFAPLFNAQKKHVLKQAVICAALGRLCWSLWKLDVASVFFNLRVVSKSHAEILENCFGTVLIICPV